MFSLNIIVKKSDIFWGYFATVLSLGLNIIIVPLVLYFLDDNETALYYIFTSLSAIATLFDFGFSPSIARAMAYAWSGSHELVKTGASQGNDVEPNYQLMVSVIHACKIIYTLLAFTALLLSLTLGTYYVKYITKEYSNSQYVICWMIYATAIFLNILYSYYSVFLRGVGAVAEINKSTVFAKLAQLIICIVLLFSGAGLLGVSIAYLIFGFLFRLIAKHYFYHYKGIGGKIKSLQKVFGYSEVKSIIKTMWPNTWRDGIVTISNYFLNQATTVFASLFVSLQDTSVFSLCVQLTMLLSTVSGTMYTTCQPALQSAFVSKDIEAQRKYMSLVLVSFVSIFFIGMVVLCTIGNSIITWIKPSYSLPLLLLLGEGFYQFLLKHRNCFTAFISSTNRLIYWKSFAFSAVVCVVLSLLFSGLFKLGAYGLILAQLFSQLIYNAWYWPLFVYRELNITVIQMFKLGIRELKKLYCRTR